MRHRAIACIALALTTLTAGVLVAADTTAGGVDLKTALDDGQIAITFTGKDQGASLDVTVENVSAAAIKVVVAKGTTTFEHAMGSIAVVAPSAQTVALPVGAKKTLTFAQTGSSGRLQGGSMTMRKAPPAQR